MAYPFHLVDCSPWPILMALAMFSGAVCVVSWMNLSTYYSLTMILPIVIVVLWWRDVIRETKGGYHTTVVQRGIFIGFLIFLLSEVM